MMVKGKKRPAPLAAPAAVHGSMHLYGTLNLKEHLASDWDVLSFNAWRGEEYKAVGKRFDLHWPDDDKWYVRYASSSWG